MSDRDATHVVYVLSSTAQPNLFRYVGCTENPVPRLANHCTQVTLAGIWIYWERISGHEIVMREIARTESKEEGRAIEAVWITSLTGAHLFNKESWPVAQSNAHVPSQIADVYKDLLRMATLKAIRNQFNDASDLVYASKRIAQWYSSLSINRGGAQLENDLRQCSRLGVADAFIPMATAKTIDSDYEGHTPSCMRLRMAIAR